MGKFKRVMRRGVYACTIVLLTGFVMSFVAVSIEHRFVVSWYSRDSESTDKATVFMLWVNDGRFFFGRYGITVELDPKTNQLSEAGQTSHGVVHEPILHGPSERLRWLQSELFSRPWWSPILTAKPINALFWDIELPLMYPLVILILVSTAKLKNTCMRSRLDVCRNCGYSLEGLTTNTCPECGATITHA